MTNPQAGSGDPGLFDSFRGIFRDAVCHGPSILVILPHPPVITCKAGVPGVLLGLRHVPIDYVIVDWDDSGH